MLSIEKKKEGNEMTIELVGSLDTVSAPELDEVVKTELEGVETLNFDFKALDYVSSAGLRVLLAAQKTMVKQGEMVVRNVPERVMDVLDVTGFSEILNIE